MTNLNLGDFYALATAVVWAAAVIYFRIAGFYLAVLPLKIFHNTVATFLFAVATLIFGQSLIVDFTWNEWLLILASGFCGITIGDTLYVAAINRLGAGAQAIIDCLYSPFVIFFAFLFFSETLNELEILGAFLIITAVFLGEVRTNSTKSDSRGLTLGLCYGVLSQLAMALTVILLKDLLQKEMILTVMTYRFAFGNLLLILAFSFFPKKRQSLWQGFRLNQTLKWSLGGAVLGPFVATFFWFLGFKYTLAGRAAVYNQLSSIFIILFATIFLREKLTFYKLISVLLAAVGGFLVSWQNS